MADDLDDTIRQNAQGPAKAAGDAGSVEQHKLSEQIEADKYHPTPEEIAAKCELLRTIDNWQGAYARAPRGGKYAVMETKGL